MGRAIFHETSVFRTPASPNASREMCGGNAPPAPLEALPSTHRLARPQPRFRALPELLKRVAGAGRALPRPLPPGSAPSLPRSAPGSGGGSGQPRACGATWCEVAPPEAARRMDGTWAGGWGQVEGVSALVESERIRLSCPWDLSLCRYSLV